MAYRHLLLLGESDTGGAKLDHVDLGPARATATIPGVSWSTCAQTDRIIETTLAPAALLSARFGLLPEGTNAAELEALLGFFYRLPRLPKLANPGVLRRALAEGVEKGLFGLASGSAWDAEDAVLRFSQSRRPHRDPVPARHLARPRGNHQGDARQADAAAQPRRLLVRTGKPTGELPGTESFAGTRGR